MKERISGMQDPELAYPAPPPFRRLKVEDLTTEELESYADLIESNEAEPEQG